MKKFISLFLVFSILILFGNMFAKERRGAELIVQKKLGQVVWGELVAVKENSLLLLERDSGADVSVDVSDVKVIKIIKKSAVGKGFGIGFLVGAIPSGALFVAWAGAEGGDKFGAIIAGLIIGLGTGGLGALISGIASKDETIQFEGRSDSEIKWHLEKLRKKARVKNYQ